MQWSDIKEIIEGLEENFPDVNIENIKLSKLHKLIIELSEFNDIHEVPTQSILEEILDAWLILREKNEENY